MKLFLPDPITKVTCSHLEFNPGCLVTTATMQGWRKTMQDRFTIQQITPNITYIGLFDGHGGSEVAEYISRILHKQIVMSPFFELENFQKALTNTFRRIDEMLLSKSGQSQLMKIQKELKLQPGKQPPAFQAGCTATVILIREDKFWVSNIGDSRAILCCKNQAIPISLDHKPEDIYEYTRIKGAGGDVKNGRILGGLNLSRAFGDFSLKSNRSVPYNEQMVTCIPTVIEQKRSSEDQFIFLASDGIWENYGRQNQKLVDQLNEMLQKIGNTSESLKDLLQKKLIAQSLQSKYGLDNMTAILIQFTK